MKIEGNKLSKNSNLIDKVSTGGSGDNISYKWIALFNVTLSSLMGTINGSIILVSLPAIFNGIHINPMAPNAFQYLLWILMGYGLVTATLLLSIGRLADIYGRVKLFRLGFLIFTIGSILLYLTPSTGNTGALELIIFRLIQAVGGAFTMANGAAIITDAFPVSERGKALGINMVAIMSGQFIGLLLGGILVTYNWRYVFLVNIPFAVLGTVWSYWKMKEVSFQASKTSIDVVGNLVFVGGLTSLLVGVTYGLMPYEHNGITDAMGWSSPWVIAAIVVGLLLLISFPFVESKVKNPVFRLEFFRIRAFAYANIANFTAAIARGGVMFMLILLLQGIWLPLHGYRFEDTPLWAGIYMLPMTLGFVVMGPISGILSDKYGPRWIATAGMAIVTLVFIGLALLPYNFDYWELGILIFFMGIGNGMFSSPNSSSIMNSVPPEDRGVASGMMFTLSNSANTLSMAVFFTIVIVGIQETFPGAIQSSFASFGSLQITSAVQQLADHLAAMSPTNALFSAFLGYNPMDSILGAIDPSIVNSIPQQIVTTLKSNYWFPKTLQQAFMPALRISFIIGAVFSGIAAALSAMRGERYVHETNCPANDVSISGFPGEKESTRD
ncbi:MFS transporter [Methanosarcina sp. Z-7115]|uniref:MFS transporter n=1 Tax=Methanosarcina baikalica TaxID=3073890 RepID=A0ABU2CZ59_9EURY|nr:MFS transporter [Methanosarcina sp. Z-7115]MDR7665029.1 MFS transporter [Methanosarcina sp. Z-7115]